MAGGAAARVVGLRVEALGTKHVTVEVRLAPALANVLVAAVDLALGRSVPCVIVVDRKYALAIDAHADPTIRGHAVRRACARVNEIRIGPGAGRDVKDAEVVGDARGRKVCGVEGIEQHVRSGGIEARHAGAVIGRIYDGAGRKGYIVQVGGEHAGLSGRAHLGAHMICTHGSCEGMTGRVMKGLRGAYACRFICKGPGIVHGR